MKMPRCGQRRTSAGRAAPTRTSTKFASLGK